MRLTSWHAISVAMLTVGLVIMPQLGRAQDAAGEAQSPEEMISLNFAENIELRILIDYVSQRLNINIVYGEEVGGQRVVIKSNAQVPRSALLTLLQSSLQIRGFALVDTGTAGIKKIVTPNNLPANSTPATQPGAQMDATTTALTEVFNLQHIDAPSADAAMKLFLTQPGGNSWAIPAQRLIIVTDFASNMNRVRSLIKAIDRPRAEVAIEFVPLTNADAVRMAPQVAQILNARINAQGGAVPGMGAIEVAADPRTNQIAIIGPRERVGDVLDLVKKIDIPSPLDAQTYRFLAITPERVDKMVRQLLGPEIASRLYQSTFDNDSGILVAVTTPDIHKRMTQLQRDVDVMAEESPIRFYKLANTTAKDVLRTLRGIEGDGGGQADLPESEPNSGRSAFRQGYRPQFSTTQPSDNNGRVFGSLNPRPQQTEPDGELTYQTEDSRVTADVNTNTIIVVGSPGIQRMYEQIIRTLDKRRPQVLVECIIVTLDTSRNFSLGVEIGANTDVGEGDLLTFSSFGLSRVNPKTGGLAIRPGLGFNGALINSDVADVVVRALLSTGRAKVVSAPRILVNDNAVGTLESLSEAPYTSINANDIVSTTSFAGYAAAGTFITLTPHISEASYLQLEYAVSLNSFTGPAVNGIPPPRQTDAVESTVTIPDGSTIVVGGLNRRNFRQNVDAIPVLGELPLLELLFSSRTTSDEQTTLFVFIRPLILRDDQFQDLKYLSRRDAKGAGLDADEPQSEPLIMY